MHYHSLFVNAAELLGCTLGTPLNDKSGSQMNYRLCITENLCGNFDTLAHGGDCALCYARGCFHHIADREWSDAASKSQRYRLVK
jgi:hypothetical protein